MMVSAVLGRAMPRKAVLEMMMTGRLISPQEALRLGAVSRVVGREELDTAVDEVVEELASKSPAVLELGRDSFNDVTNHGLGTALARLQNGLTAVSLTADSHEGVQAFLERRPPRWTGR